MWRGRMRKWEWMKLVCVKHAGFITQPPFSGRGSPCWVSGRSWMPRGVALWVGSAEQRCRCVLQMNNRSFSLCVTPPPKTLFPLLSFLISLSVTLPVSPLLPLRSQGSPQTSLLLSLPLLPTPRINVDSHMPPAESQLSLLLHRNGPGRTSGTPWQGSHPAQPPPSSLSRLTRDLSLAFFPPTSWNNRTAAEPKQRGEACLFISEQSMQARARGVFQHHAAFINYQLIQD